MIPRSDSQSRMLACSRDWQSSALRKIGVVSDPGREVETTCAPIAQNHNKYYQEYNIILNDSGK